MIRFSDSTPPVPIEHARIGWRHFLNEFSGTLTITATTETAAEPVSNLLNPATYLKWRADDTSTQNIDVDLGSGVFAGADYWAVAGHNLGTVGATGRLYYSDDGMSYTAASPAYEFPDDNVFIDEIDPSTHRYWRLQITGADDPPAIAVLHIGAVTRMPVRIYVGHTPITKGKSTRFNTSRSQSGEFLGRQLASRSYQSQAQFMNLSQYFLRDTEWEAFDTYAETQPFFWAWRGTYPQDVAYAWLTADIQMSNQRPNGMMQASLSLEGIR